MPRPKKDESALVRAIRALRSRHLAEQSAVERRARNEGVHVLQVDGMIAPTADPGGGPAVRIDGQSEWRALRALPTRAEDIVDDLLDCAEQSGDDIDRAIYSVFQAGIFHGRALQRADPDGDGEARDQKIWDQVRSGVCAGFGFKRAIDEAANQFHLSGRAVRNIVEDAERFMDSSDRIPRNRRRR